MQDTHKDIPIVLIHGSLGSGKTTLIKELLAQPELAEALIIENEFASEDIDSGTIDAHRHGKTVSITGGCICCSSAEELEEALKEVVRLSWNKPVIIETTGVASSVQLLQKLFLDITFLDNFSIVRNIFVVDSLEVTPEMLASGLKLETILADVVVLNKVSLAGADRAQALRQAIKDVNPSAAVVATDHAQVSREELDLSAGSAVEQALAEHYDELITGNPPAHNLRYEVFELTESMEKADFESAVKKLQSACDVRRCKGYFSDSSGIWWHYEATPNHADFLPVAPRQKAVIVFIGSDVTERAIREAGFGDGRE